MTESLGSTARTRVRRLPEKAATDRSALHEVLDAGLVAHVAVTDNSGPNGAAQPYIDGAPTCFTVTLLDGLVVARSAFESSMNYRGAMVLGTSRMLPESEKEAALERITEHLMPGRWKELRAPKRKELAATVVLSLPLTEASVKISAGGPDDDPDDLDAPVWAGVVPLHEVYCDPTPATNLAPGIDVPDYMRRWRR